MAFSKRLQTILVMLILILASPTISAQGDSSKLKTEELVLQALDGQQRHILESEGMTLIYFTRVGCKYCIAFEEKAMFDLISQINESEHINMRIVVFEDFQGIEEKYDALSANVFFGTSQIRDVFQIKGVPSFFLISANGEVKWKK